MTSKAALSIALGALFIGALLIGFWCARRTQSVSDFHLAGRTLGPFRAALSQAAGAYGLWILIGVSGAAYTLGLAAAWIGAGVLAGAALTWFYVGPAIHRHARASGATTAFELLGGSGSADASRGVSQSAAGIAAVAVFFGLCAQLSIAAGIAARVLTLHHATAVLLIAGTALIAALLGGLRALSIVGVLCAVLIAAIALLMPLAPLLLLDSLEGLRTALAQTGAHALDPLGGYAGSQAVVFVLAGLGIGVGLCGQPQLLDQFIATRSEKSVRWGGAIALAWFTVVLLSTLLLGWCARALYESIDSGDAVFVEVAERLLPPVMLAAPLFAIVAAVVACLGTQLLVVSDALVLLTSRTAEGGPTVLRLRTALLIAGTAATTIAALAHLERARVVLLCWLATAAVLGPLFLVRSSGVRIRPAYSAAAMRIGIVLTLLLFVLRRDRNEWLAAVLPFTIALAVAVLGRERK